ncbi:MAG: class I SAM-dependent methyltransferase [Candidatus Sigynarchaeota archaeon]
MCRPNCLSFVARALQRDEIENKRVLEIGSYDVNGKSRNIVEMFHPREYFGIDIKAGKNVDMVCDIEHVVNKFGRNSFDVVITTELLEHVKDWRKAISNIKNVLKEHGVAIITTVPRGYPYHPDPEDYWRYEKEDVKIIFKDFEILMLEEDYIYPGIFFKVRKADDFQEVDLSHYMLYNIVERKRIPSWKNVSMIKLVCKKLLKRTFQLLHGGLERCEKLIIGL